MSDRYLNKKKIHNMNLCSPAKSHTLSSQNKHKRTAGCRDNDTGTNRRNPNRGDGDSPGERQGRGKNDFCPILIRCDMGWLPRVGLLLLSEIHRRVGLQMYITFRDTFLYTACMGMHTPWCSKHNPTAQAHLQQAWPYTCTIHTHLWHRHTTSAHSHEAAAHTHTAAARRAHPRHPWAHTCAVHVCAMHTPRAPMAHSYSMGAHTLGTHGHTPVV